MAVGDGVSALASLAVTFGGFSPTAMDGVAATKEHIERIQATHAARRKAEMRRREIELARASAPKRFTDEEGMTWTYVVMDETFIRIDKCTRERESVRIPVEIEGMPVRAIGPDVFNESDVVQEIVCPDGVEAIGPCAFRFLESLRRVVFPASVATYSGSWLQHCTSIEEIVLPGLLNEITSAVFENTSLKRLYVGKAVSNIKQGACEKTQLDLIEIHEENPFIFTDGDAVYSADGSELLALARPVASYEILKGCTIIAKKACMGIGSLVEVVIPESVSVIGEFAFAHTGLRSVEIPPTVTQICAKAFYYCQSLTSATLHEGLVEIGESAFAESALEGIYIPASVNVLGNSITEKSKVVHSGSNATFELSPDSETLYYDGQGGLYRKSPEGLHFIQLIDREVKSFSVLEGTVSIDEYAFAFHTHIERVTLPDGLVAIERCAFRVCPRLREVRIPESLERIGKEAFIDTNIESMYLPAHLHELADDALITAGAHRLSEPPSLRTILVSEDNPWYYVESGLLCRRGETGDRGIVFNDDVADVVIPDSVTTIADYAFNNARNIATFSIGPNLKIIGTNGFSTWSYIRNIHIELAEEIEGRRVFDVQFPNTDRAMHEISISLGGSAWVNVPEIYRHYDNCLAHAHNYHEADDRDITAYEQVKLMIARLKDPIMLVPVNKSMFERLIGEHLIDMCVDVARHDDREVVDDLCDLGFITADNLEEIIVAVGRLQDAAMSGYLLELKRRRYGRASFDFDL